MTSFLLIIILQRRLFFDKINSVKSPSNDFFHPKSCSVCTNSILPLFALPNITLLSFISILLTSIQLAFLSGANLSKCDFANFITLSPLSIS